MGYGWYSEEAHRDIVSKRQGKSKEEVFRQQQCHPLMDPRGVKFRESLDSEAHPESLAIIFALDVTGSMEEIPTTLAQQTMPDFMKLLLDVGVKDPQVLFAGVGDAFTDDAPLQIGQFESEAELMDQWLTRVYLEGGGGGNDGESYDLALYFAARHTKIDCWDKRHKQGYLFITGDDELYPEVTREHVRTVFDEQIDENIPIDDMLAEVSERYHVFFLVPGKDRNTYTETWHAKLGDRVIVMDSPWLAAATAAALVGIGEDKIRSATQAAETLIKGGTSKDVAHGVAKAIEQFAHTFALERQSGE